MSIEICVNGQFESLVTQNSLVPELNVNFKEAFNYYLQSTYGITEEQFMEIIIENMAPEQFI